MSIKTQATQGLKWQAIELIGRQLLSLLVFGALSRLLEPAAFGVFGLVNVYLAFISMFASQGIRAALIQRKDLHPEHIDTAYWFSLASASILCLATMALANPVSALLGEPKLAPYLRWSSLLLIISASSTIHNTLFVKAMDFRRPAIRLLLSNFVGGLFGVVMAFGGYGVWALVGQQLTVALTSAVFLWIASEYRPAFRFSMARYRELRGVSSSVFATSLLWFLSSRLDQLIISRFAGVTTLGVYIIGSRLPELGKLVTHQPISQVSMPTLAKLQHDHAQMRKVIYHGTELNAVVSFAVFVGLASVASDIVPLAFGGKWDGAAAICSLLAIYTLITVLQVFNHPALLSAGANRDYVLLSVGQTVGVLLACSVGIQFGAQYVALGMIINALILAVPSQLLLRKWVGIDPWLYCRRCLTPAVASILMTATIWGVSQLLPTNLLPVVRLAIKVPIGAVVYLGTLWIIDRKILVNFIALFSQALSRSKVQPSAPLPIITNET